MNLSLPDLPAGLPIETIYHPVMSIPGRVGPFPTKVQSLLGCFDFPIFKDRSNEDLVTPNNWRRPTDARNRHSPGHILISAPGSWKVRSGTQTQRAFAA